MEEFLPTATIIGLIISTVNFLLYLRNKSWDPLTKMLAAYAGGVGAVLLAAQTDFAAVLEYGGVTLAAANIWTQIFIGLTLGGSGTVVNEFKKAFDANDSAKKPSLVGPPED